MCLKNVIEQFMPPGPYPSGSVPPSVMVTPSRMSIPSRRGVTPGATAVGARLCFTTSS